MQEVIKVDNSFTVDGELFQVNDKVRIEFKDFMEVVLVDGRVGKIKDNSFLFITEYGVGMTIYFSEKLKLFKL